MKSKYRLPILFFALLCSISEAADQKVAGKYPMENFSSTHNGRYTSNDLMLVVIVAKRPELSLMTNSSREEVLSIPFMRPLVEEAQWYVYAALANTAADEKGQYHGDVLNADALGLKRDRFELPKPLKPLRVRNSWDELAKPFDKTAPAKVAYNRNLLSEEDIWSAKGAIGYDLYFEREGIVREFHAIPNASFDRVKGGTKESDSLTFRLGAVTTLSPGSASNLIHDHILRVAPVYATDFGFNSEQLGGELEWEFVSERLHLDSGFVIRCAGKEAITVLPRLFFHFEGGTVRESGGNTNLVEDKTYFRIGPVVQLQLGFGRDMPEPLQRLNFVTAWREYERLNSDTRSTRLFTAGCGYKIAENISFEIEYRKGRIPLTAEKVESVNVGLGLKF